jgi:hypothetical protein
MSKKFKCLKCQKWHNKNPRIKFNQCYCGSKECQQARKNSWEKEKLQKDTAYKALRQAAKKKSYSGRHGYKYQIEYRNKHPGYNTNNRQRQNSRNKKRTSPSPKLKIVKTDALNSTTIATQGLYVLIPYQSTDAKKIVKTDALIVRVVTASGLYGDYGFESG